MAKKYFVGNGSGDPNLYSNANNWDPVGVPVNGDDVYFTGSRAVTFVTAPAAAQDAPDNIHVLDDFNYTIGTSGSPLLLGTVTSGTVDRINFAGTAEAHIHVDTSRTVTDLQLRSRSKTGYLNIGGGGTWTNFYAIRGRYLVKSAAKLVNLFHSYNTSPRSDVEGKIETGLQANSLQIMQIAGGQLTLNSGQDTTTYAAEFTDQAQVVMGAGNLAVARIVNALVEYNTNAGLITKAILHGGGVLRLGTSGTPKTLTNTIIHGGVLDLVNAGDITFTNAIVKIGDAGQILANRTINPILF